MTFSPTETSLKSLWPEGQLATINPETKKEEIIEATLLSTKVEISSRLETKSILAIMANSALRESWEPYPQPTLVWMLENKLPKPQKLEASYLTSGINWKADYVAVLNKLDTLTDLTGWVTIDNRSGATYQNALLKLVAVIFTGFSRR